MTNAPSGWYDDGSGRDRWWDGTAWSPVYRDQHEAPRSTPFRKPRAYSKPPRKGGWKRGVLIAALVFLIVVAASGGWGSLLLMLGVGGLVAGVVALAKGAAPAVGIRSRAVGSVVVASAVISMAFGSAFLGGASAMSTAGSANSSVTVDRSNATPKPTPTPTPTPRRTVEMEEVREPIPFETREVEDSSLDLGTRVLATAGVDGVRRITYEVVYEDGREVSRTEVSNVISAQPVHEVTAVGTWVEPPPPPAPEASGSGSGCDPNYSGACVPIAYDVDCAGGSGNGPAYVGGPVYVVGWDIYDLDRDGDGVACD